MSYPKEIWVGLWPGYCLIRRNTLFTLGSGEAAGVTSNTQKTRM